MAWKADQVQGVLFPIPSTQQVEAADLWKAVVDGIEPSSIRRPDASVLSMSFAEGIVDGRRLVIQAQLGRIDLTILSAANTVLPQEPPRLENVSDCVDMLETFLVRAISATRIVRFGVIANLTEIHLSLEDVADRMTVHCGGVFFPRPALDCVYQINARKIFRDTTIEMNRVVTWASGTYTLAIQQQLPFTTIIPQQIAKTIPMLSFKIDVNSATEYEISDSAPSYLKQACAETANIIASGIEALR